jgi:hypothetical protein
MKRVKLKFVITINKVAFWKLFYSKIEVSTWF